jgi:Ca2+-binding EF-hand superfamily protein
VKRSISDIAIQTLQDERWRGTEDQNVMLMRKVCAGRSELLIQYLSKFRDAFELADKDNRNEVSLTDLAELFRRADIPFTTHSFSIQYR